VAESEVKEGARGDDTAASGRGGSGGSGGAKSMISVTLIDCANTE
jgi:hypothetical protein